MVCVGTNYIIHPTLVQHGIGIHAHEWPAASDGRHDAHSDGPRKPLAAVLMLVTLLVCCVKASLLLMPWCTVAPPSSDSIF